MTLSPLLIVVIVLGLSSAWACGTFIAQRRFPISCISAWVSLACLWLFITYQP